MGHHDLLDVTEAILLEPLRDHPDEMQKFREETLYAPLAGSKAARKRAQKKALAGMGIDMDNFKVGQGLGRKARGRAAKADREAKAAEEAEA